MEGHADLELDAIAACQQQLSTRWSTLSAALTPTDPHCRSNAPDAHYMAAELPNNH